MQSGKFALACRRVQQPGDAVGHLLDRDRNIMFVRPDDADVGTGFGYGHAPLGNACQHQAMPFEIMAVSLMDVQQYFGIFRQLRQVTAIDHIGIVGRNWASQPRGVQKTIIAGKRRGKRRERARAPVVQCTGKQDIIGSVFEPGREG